MARLVAVALGLVAVANAASTLHFGKFKWGQDEDSLFITVYAPGMKYEDATIAVNDTHFKINGPNPAKATEPLDLEFEFREDVVSSNMTHKAWGWKSGTKHNSIFFTIPKRHHHFFDRLCFQQVTRAFKARMEIDWNRYKRDGGEDAEEEELEEEEEEAWEDDYDREQKGNLFELTNSNFKEKLASTPYMAVLATYPWCKICKNTHFLEVFSRTARNKNLKAKMLFAKADLREHRWVGRVMNAGCGDTCTKNVLVFRDGVLEGSYNGTMGTETEKDEQEKQYASEAEAAQAYFTRHMHPSPWPLASMKDLEAMKAEGDKTMPIGFFGSGHAEQRAAFEMYVQEKRGETHHGLVTDETATATILKSLLPDTGDLLKPPLVVMYKNFGNEDEDQPLVFGAGVNDTFSRDGINDFIKHFNYQPLVWLNTSDSDGKEAGLQERRLPVAHLWVDKASLHAQTLKAVRRAAVQLQRKVAFIYHDFDRESEGATQAPHVTEGARKQLLSYGLDGSTPPLFGLSGHGQMHAFSDSSHGHKDFAFPEFSAKTTDTEIVAWVEKVLVGEVKPATRSEPRPKDPPSADAMNPVVGHTFVESIMKNEKDVLLNMYRRDQPLYKIVQPELKKVAKVLAQLKAPAQVFAYCWEDNDIPKEAAELEMIKRFTPVGTSLVFFLPGGKKGHGVQRYNGGDQGHHSADKMLEHIFQHASKPFDLTRGKVMLKELSEDHPSPYQAQCGAGAEPCKGGFSCEHNVCHWTGNAAELAKFKLERDKPEPTEEEKAAAKKKEEEEKAAAEAAQLKTDEEKLAGARKVEIKGDGIVKHVYFEGKGESPGAGAQVTAHYTGTLLNGDKFDSSRDRSQPFAFTLGQGQVIPCWDQGFATMKKGEKAVLTCKSEYGYGDAGSPPKIPGKATLKFDVELIDFSGGAKSEL